MKIDLSLKNAILYDGCEIKEIGGRLTLVTEPFEASNIVGRNVNAIIEATPAGGRGQVVHKFRKFVYNDGRGGEVIVAQH